MVPVAPMVLIVKSNSHSQPSFVAVSRSNTPLVDRRVAPDFTLIIISDLLPPPVAFITPPIFA